MALVESHAFGEQLRHYRVVAGLTQEQLAEKAGLSARGISDLERGARRAPYVGTIRRLADALSLGPRERRALISASGRTASDEEHKAEPPAAPLPSSQNTFVGRENELAEIRRALREARLLTLVGPGGVGKTRLAMRVAEQAPDEVRDGVFIVELAPLSNAALLPQTLATSLGLHEHPGESLLETVSSALAPKRALLIFDNCEHLIRSSAEVADRLLRDCPHIRIMATSREPLRMKDENVQRVPSLTLPSVEKDPSPASLQSSEAVRLLLDRGRSVQPGFELNAHNAAAIADICNRLDGIPLAIELAAARLRVLTVGQISTRLEDRFRLLSRGDDRLAPSRHQTLHAMIDWSYELLSDAERAAFARMSVFAGGLDVESAERVVGGHGVDADDVLDLIAELVDKSLVVAEPGPVTTMRYRLLETMRQYARERLVQRGELQLVSERHARYFLDLSERAEEQLTGPDQGEWLNQLKMENDNLRAALAWCGAEGDPVTGLRLAGALWRFWSMQGHLSEGRDHLQQLLATSSAEDTDEQLQSARARALHGTGTIAAQQGDYIAARGFLEQAIGLRRSLGDLVGTANSLNNLGIVARFQGDYAAARSLYQESLELQQQLQNKPGIALALNNLGLVCRFQGDVASARDFLGASLVIRREIQDPWGIANGLNSLAELSLDEGQYATSRALLNESLNITRELGDPRAIAFLLEDFGALAASEGHPGRAILLISAAEAIREKIGAPLSPTEQSRLAEFQSKATSRLKTEEVERARAEGRSLHLDAAIACALTAYNSELS